MTNNHLVVATWCSFTFHSAGPRSAIGRAPDISRGSWVRYPVWPHTFVSPSAFSRRAVVSYWRKYVHEVLVNRLGGLSLPRKSVVRLTDRPDMTLDVYRGRKTTNQQQPSIQGCSDIEATELRPGIEDNSKMIFLISRRNHML